MNARSQPVQAELARTRTQAATLERLQLLAAFTQMFRALRDPVRVALLHPPRPGSTLPLGARVPGTSLELEPASAAFCLGALLHAAPVAVDAALAPALAAADHAARRAHYEGREPPTLQSLHEALAYGRAQARACAAANAASDPRYATRVAGACAAALLLGASEEAACRVATVVAATATTDTAGATVVDIAATPAGATGLRESTAGLGTAIDVEACRAAGEEAACALRHALAALDAGESAVSVASLRIAAPADGTARLAPPPAVPLAQVEAEFAAAVAALFPARYVPGALDALADAESLRASPVDALLARLVRN